MMMNYVSRKERKHYWKTEIKDRNKRYNSTTTLQIVIMATFYRRMKKLVKYI